MQDIFFKIGDVVIHRSNRIPTGKYVPGDETEGEVVAMIWGDMPKVRWNNGITETYSQGDLKLIERKRG